MLSSPYIPFNTIPPCSSQDKRRRRRDGGEGRGVKEKNITRGVIGAKILRLDALPVKNQC